MTLCGMVQLLIVGSSRRGHGAPFSTDACMMCSAVVRSCCMALLNLGCGSTAGTGVLSPARSLAAELARGPCRPPRGCAWHPRNMLGLVGRRCAILGEHRRMPHGRRNAIEPAVRRPRR